MFEKIKNNGFVNTISSGKASANQLVFSAVFPFNPLPRTDRWEKKNQSKLFDKIKNKLLEIQTVLWLEFPGSQGSAKDESNYVCLLGKRRD